MSVVRLSSPLSFSLSNANVHLGFENGYSSVSSLLVDYTLLNSIVDSNQFEKSLEIYSLMLNNCLNNRNEKSLEIFLKEFFKEYCSIYSNDLKEFFEIVQNPDIHSLICTYDSIVRKDVELSSNIGFDLSEGEENHLENNDYSNKKRENCIISMSCSTKLIDEEKENLNYASKLIEYNVTRLKIVRLEKRQGEPLGATISRLSDDDYRISIARIVHGSISQGLFSVGDQLLEINDLPIQSEYRTLDQIVQLIDSLQGLISFLLLPSIDQTNHGTENQAFDQNPDQNSSEYVRALFSYDPYDDVYIPCRELGLSFEKGSILEIVNRDDPSWWQAFVIGNDEEKGKQGYPALIPSKEFQEKRLKIVKCLLDEETNHRSKKGLKDKWNKCISQQSRRENILTTFNFGIYERVQWFIPDQSRKRPIVLIGPPHIGRHELRQRLMNSPDLVSLIDVAVPHTTRLKKDDEIDGRDYHFITRSQFEKDISNDLFVEHGEYEKNLYGTSKLAIEKCSKILNKISILNLLPEGLHSLKFSNLLPFIIYIKPPTTIEKLKESLPINEEQWNEIEEKSHFIEQNYSHLFDQTLSFNHSFNSLFLQLKILVKDVQIKPMWINQFWFSPRERF